MKTCFGVVWLLALLSLPAAGMAQSEGAETMEMPKVAAGSGEHQIGGVELIFSDAAQSQQFYEKVFGWTFVPFEDDYFFFATPKGLGGGFSSKEAVKSLNGMLYLYTPDVDAKLAEITAAGGSVVAAKEVVDPESGAGFALFRDPAGVIMALMDLPMPQDYAPDPFGDIAALTPGSIVSVELYGGDLTATGKFYRELFGWQTMEAMPQFLLFNTGQGIGGVFQGHTPGLAVMLYIWVDDVAAALDAVEAAGGKRLGDAMKMEGMPAFGYFTDPAGKSVGLMGPAK